MNLSTVKWAQWDKTQSRQLFGLFICVCIALCRIVVHNIAYNRPDNFPSYPPDNHHCSDDVSLREGGTLFVTPTHNHLAIANHRSILANGPLTIQHTTQQRVQTVYGTAILYHKHASNINTRIFGGWTNNNTNQTVLCTVSHSSDSNQRLFQSTGAFGTHFASLKTTHHEFPSLSLTEVKFNLSSYRLAF